VSPEVTRRQFVLRSSLALASAIGAGLAFEGLVREPQYPVAERMQVFLERLPEAFDGFRIAQITDIHFGPYMTQPELERSLRIAQAFQPDLIALTGDFVSHPWGKRNGKEGARLAEPCADVLARATGVPIIAVLGNHDHWNDADLVAGALTERRIRVLRNQSQVIERGNQKLWIAGVDDPLEEKADLAKTMTGIPRSDATLLLAHEPDFADYAARFPVDLQLSGHSHGGQVRIPGVGPIILPAMAHKYHTGFNRVGSLQVYTSRGVGVINPPVRLNCPPEVSLITLRTSQGRA
jgi:predicted MPP superfamily phosphohydrolase